jgi:diguanylate cyclase (GGDEF)-like protein
MGEEQVEYLIKYFNIHRNAFCTTRLDKEYLEHKKMIDVIFGVNTINTWFCAPIFVNEQMNSLFIACMSMCSDWNHRIKRNSFVESDVGIMLLMYRQLIDAIERVESRNEIEKMNNELQHVNERLKNLAVRDTLTGLYNRQGFSEELDFLAERAKRENCDKELSILYADLDNFKFYNDTFGHDIGDFILVQFATLLKQICGPDGYVVRYGGDEFIVVIHSADREYIENAAKRIYEILKEEKGFTDKISDKLGVEVNIPEEKYVSCSIGISSAIINPENSKKKIDDAIKQADEMMYYIKKTVKHRYVFYDDVEHDCK